MADDQPQAAAADGADGELVHVKITAPDGATYNAKIRKLGQPVPPIPIAGTSWEYDLPAGTKWIWTVNITGVAGVSGSFAITGATKTGPTKFTIPGDVGVVSGTVLEIMITV